MLHAVVSNSGARPAFALAALLAAGGAQATGLDCVRYETFLHRIGGTQFPASDISVSGDFAYVTAGTDLRIVEVSDPSAPRVRGSIGVVGSPRRAAVSGAVAFVVTPESGLQILDVSNPDAPFQAGWVDTPGSDQAVAVSGPMAYVAAGAALLVIDASNPFAPRRVGTASTSGTARDVTLSGDRAYVTCSYGLEVFDVSSPTTPARIGGLALAIALHVDVEGGRAYVVDGVWLRIVDISDPGALHVAGEIRVATEVVAGHVVVAGSTAFVSAGGQVQVLDISVPAEPRRLGSIAASNVALVGTLAYAAAGNYGLQVFDFSNPAPAPVLTAITTPFANGITLSGTHLFGAHYGGLYIVDISEPYPQLVGSVSLPGSPNDVVVAGGVAFVAANGAGLHAVDVSDPSAPVLLDTWTGPANVHHVLAAGSYVYAISGPIPDTGDVLTILDASDPTSLKPLGYWVELGTYSEFALAGNLLYAVGSALAIFDISNPAAPGPIGTIQALSGSDIALDGTHAYVAGSSSGLLVIDVTDPRAPRLETSIPTPTVATRVAVTGGIAYVTDALGLQVIDVTDPLAPQQVGDVSGGGVLATDGTRLYVAGSTALQILPLQCPTTVDVDPRAVPRAARLLQPHPNPFNPSTTIPFELDISRPLRLAVYAPDGRLVRELLRGVRPSGRGNTRWDGRDAAGARVASGIYLVRFESGSASMSRKIVLIE